MAGTSRNNWYFAASFTLRSSSGRHLFRLVFRQMKTHVVTTAAPTSALIQNNPVTVLIAGKFDLPQPAAPRTELLIDPKPTWLRIEPLRPIWLKRQRCRF